MKKLVLNFYNTFAVIETEWTAILNVIAKDFSCFVSEERSIGANWKFHVVVYQKPSPEGFIPEIQATLQTNNSISYDLERIRYSDYYGKLHSKLDFDKNFAELYSENFDRTHEVLYLLLLSRIGKRLDLVGLHKLHAFAISFQGKAAVCMMPMKGGKSTLLLELLRYDGVKLISDDIPLFDLWGNIKPFPLKIGLESNSSVDIKIENPNENIYHMNREIYGDKKLICLNGLLQKIESIDAKFEQIYLIESFRVNSQHSFLSDEDFFSCLKGLLKHGVIGFGLPIVYEFFWEFGWKDFIRKTFIFFRRLLAFSLLAFRAKKFKLKLGKKPEKAAKLIWELLS